MKIRRFIQLGAVALVAAAAACDGGATEETSSDYAEFQTAVPGMQMVTLSFEDTATTSGALTTEEGALAEPGAFKAHAQAVMDKVNQALQYVHQRAEETFADAEPVVTTKGAMECRTWEADGGGGNAHWRLTSCLKDNGAKKFEYLIEGRPIDSESDDDYLTVFAGEGKLLPQSAQPGEVGNGTAKAGGLRGAGHIGYNFDNFATLTSQDVAGRLGVGYHGLGAARHLVLALDGVKIGDHGPRTGIYRYKRVIGKGGHFSYVGQADWVTTDADGAFVAGKDGVDEVGRAAIAWKASGEARTAVLACEGTLGAGSCIHLVQCWSKAGAEEWAGTAAGAKGKPAFDKKACPAVPFDVELPGEGDLDAPAPDAAAGAPLVDEPTAAE